MANPNVRFKNARKKVPFGHTSTQRTVASAPSARIFNGKEYFSVFGSNSKSQVDDLAKQLKDTGYSIRTIKTKVGKRIYYDLYARKGS